MRPLAVRADRQKRELTISWDDNHTSVYSFSLLRRACPCAECRGGHAGMRPKPDPTVFSQGDEDSPATRLENVQAVGGYALSFVWEDGHHYGIFSWDYLRDLCPCPICRL
jgi:DUF971 family protein